MKSFFNDFEEKFGTLLPLNIKKTLEAMLYSRCTITRVSSEVLADEIQETIRNQMPLIVPEDEQESFFGPLFKSCPMKFVFFSGQLIILNLKYINK